MYKTLDTSYNNTLVIKKSTFITNVFPIENVSEAQTILTAIKKEHSSANHNCYAYVLNNQTIQKCSDDGEPNRTAGYPILNILLQNDLDNVLCIVTRYFGGIKLGGGGLIRAYASSASNAIMNANLINKQQFSTYEITFAYSDIDHIDHLLQKNDISLINKHFYDFVVYEISLTAQEEWILKKIITLTKNRALIEKKNN